MQVTEPTVIATFSRRMRLQLPDDQQVDARIKGKRLKVVCGDRVAAEPISQETDWLITAVLPRDNELSRPTLRGQAEVLAANIDLLVVVASTSPAPDWFVIDRYLSAAEQMGVQAAVVYNKVDITGTKPGQDLALHDYMSIGYPVIRCSATTGDGIDEINALLEGQASIIVGQSGVGKSSIINCITGSEALATAAISEKRDEGRHTTVNSMMIELPGGGAVIDSPGVRDFAPALESLEQVAHGFREISAAAQDCRFANCRHTREPDCAVKQGVSEGTIAERRYDSYKRLLNLTEQLAKKP